jgi:hypothetical protein
VELDEGALLATAEDHAADDLLALDEALQQFESEDPLKVRTLYRAIPIRRPSQVQRLVSSPLIAVIIILASMRASKVGVTTVTRTPGTRPIDHLLLRILRQQLLRPVHETRADAGWWDRPCSLASPSRPS